MTALNYPARVAAKASTIKAAPLVLSVLVAPFYVIGFVVGVLWLMVTWVFAAVVLGMSAAKPKAPNAD